MTGFVTLGLCWTVLEWRSLLVQRYLHFCKNVGIHPSRTKSRWWYWKYDDLLKENIVRNLHVVEPKTFKKHAKTTQCFRDLFPSSNLAIHPRLDVGNFVSSSNFCQVWIGLANKTKSKSIVKCMMLFRTDHSLRNSGYIPLRIHKIKMAKHL